ncbi:amino acid ABC transporter permease [Propionibacteriaceae bacterium Y2011]|uniref:amino acid ABC transporter permease n=1 Tax=Microlunatus sp. Y2014 TaxID=3418488 RepID=UPI003B451665
MGFFADVAELFSTYNIFSAFGVTILFTLTAGVGSLVIGTVVAILRVSPVAALRAFGTMYVTLIRNTPLTLIIFFCVAGLYLSLNWNIFPESSPIAWHNFIWGAVGLSIYHAAFVAEAIRSGVNTVPLGQAEAARAIGLNFAGTISQVVLPQAIRGAIAPLGNTLIALTKNTTVMATVTAAEAATVMRNMIEFNPELLFLTFTIMATGFIVLTLPTGILFTRLSERLAVQR